jgi:hypothetical protein
LKTDSVERWLVREEDAVLPWRWPTAQRDSDRGMRRQAHARSRLGLKERMRQGRWPPANG